ncbi:hypothetical protein [Thalassotalea sp. PLHSN55]|uniref:hypothetical protein n=1 Tax=Thalassotalea sp. PLHSN55 TaxID=3435888 RepID=UPI003F8605AA
MARVLKGYYWAIFIAVICHILLLAVIYSQTFPAFKPKQQQAIKSYLYVKPAVLPEPMKKNNMDDVIEQELTPDKAEPQSTQSKNEAPKSSKSKSDGPITVEPAAIKTVPVEETAKQSSTSAETANITNNAVKMSPKQQLEKLRSSLNRQIGEQYFQERNQQRSFSNMHPALPSVPHSTAKLSEEEKKTLNTTQLADNISITKGDNGVCFIEQDLSNVGMEGISATSAFACGESAFDKSFREHMKKVQAKLGK